MSQIKTINLFYGGPDKFRVVETGSFGDSSMVVNDGTTALFDPLDDTDTATLSAGVKAVYDANENLKFKGDGSSLLFYMLPGEDSMKVLVDPDGPIVAGPGWVSFRSKDAGSVKVLYSGPKNAERVDRIEYDNLPFYVSQHEKYPEWVPAPDGPLTSEDITYMPERLNPSLFVTAPSAGRPVKDLRKKSGQV